LLLLLLITPPLKWAIIAMYKLRPHHLLCMRLFKGEGYSEKFTSNMQSCINVLTKDSSQRFVLVGGYDDICLHCPNLNDENQCSQGNENVLHKYYFVIKTLGLKVTTAIHIKKLMIEF